MSSKSTQKEAKDLGSYGDKLVNKHDAGPTMISDDILPAQYYSRQDQERKYKFKQDYIRSLAADTTPGNKDVTYAYQPSESEIQHQVTKQREHEHVGFESWLAGVFDPGNPMEAQTLYELYPGFFDKRMDEVDRHLALQRKIAEVKNRGPTSKEDLYFMYQMAANQVPIPKGPAFQTGGVRRGELDDNPRAYGALNYKRWGAGFPWNWADKGGWEDVGDYGRIYKAARTLPVTSGLSEAAQKHQSLFSKR